MNNQLKFLISFILFLFPVFLFGQNCNNYHKSNCRWADRTFIYSRQSRSALFTPGMSSEFSIVVYGGEEYYISVDGHRKLGDIGVKIYEDDKNKTQLYSNAEFNYEQFFYFKISRTRKLIVEISTEEPKNKEKPDKKYCLGVLIEFRDNKSSEDEPKDVGF